MWRGAVKTLPAPTGVDCRTEGKVLVRPPQRHLAEGGDGAILLWTSTPEKNPGRRAPGPCCILTRLVLGLHLVGGMFRRIRFVRPIE